VSHSPAGPPRSYGAGLERVAAFPPRVVTEDMLLSLKLKERVGRRCTCRSAQHGVGAGRRPRIPHAARPLVSRFRQIAAAQMGRVRFATLPQSIGFPSSMLSSIGAPSFRSAFLLDARRSFTGLRTCGRQADGQVFSITRAVDLHVGVVPGVITRVARDADRHLTAAHCWSRWETPAMKAAARPACQAQRTQF